MINIDKQRVTAVRKLEALGYSYQGGEWVPAAPAAPQSLLMTAECDAMHGALMRRADALEGCAEGSTRRPSSGPSSTRSRPTKAVRWPTGKEPGGKG